MYNKQSYEDDSKEELFCQETNNTQAKTKKEASKAATADIIDKRRNLRKKKIRS